MNVSRRATRGISAVVAFALLAIASSGCTTNEPDVPRLEQSLAEKLQEHIGERPELDCSNATVAVASGQAIECLATLGRSTFPVALEVADEREEAIARVKARLIDATTVADLVGTRLSEELGATTIDCGGPLVAADESGIVRACTATDASGIVRALELSLTEQGAVKVELASS